MKKKLSQIEEIALKRGLECITIRKGGKDQTHCAPFDKRHLLRNIKGSIVGGVLARKGFRFTPKGDEIFHQGDEPVRKSRKQKSKRG